MENIKFQENCIVMMKKQSDLLRKTLGHVNVVHVFPEEDEETSNCCTISEAGLEPDARNSRRHLNQQIFWDYFLCSESL